MLNQYDEIITIDELCDILMIGKNLAYRLLTEKRSKHSALERNGRFRNLPLRNSLSKTPYSDLNAVSTRIGGISHNTEKFHLPALPYYVRRTTVFSLSRYFLEKYIMRMKLNSGNK